MKNKIFVIASIIFVSILAYFFYFQKFIIKPDIEQFSFLCNENSDCQLVGTECCNNNAPTQNGCINKNDVKKWEDTLQNYCNMDHTYCLEYYMMGNYSCFCENNICLTNFTDQNGNMVYKGTPRGV